MDKKQISASNKDKQTVIYGPDGRPISKPDSIKNVIVRWIKRRKLTEFIGLLLAIIGIALAIYFYYLPKGEPDLYISLSESDETFWSFDPKNPIHRHPEEMIVLQAETPSSFYECTNIKPQDVELSGRVASKFYILNIGNWKASDVWFKIFFDVTIPMRIIGTNQWNTGYDENRGQNLAYFEGNNFDVPKQAIKPTFGILALELSLIPRMYEFPYIIGAKGVKPRERIFITRLETTHVPIEYIENAKGLESARNGNLKDALDYFRYAIQKVPNSAAFQFNLGTTLLQLERAKDAEKSLLLASRLAPNISEIWGNLGVCYLMQSRWSEALEAINRTLKLNPTSQIDLDNRDFVLKKLNEMKRKK